MGHFEPLFKTNLYKMEIHNITNMVMVKHGTTYNEQWHVSMETMSKTCTKESKERTATDLRQGRERRTQRW